MNEKNTIPIVSEGQLTLRGYRPDDLDASFAMWGDAAVTRFIGGAPLTREQTWARLLRHIGHWAVLGFGYWVVEHRDSGRFVGEVGFAHFKREMEPRLDDIPEIGWVLAPWAQGRGWATEAVRAALSWGDQQLASQSSICIITPENAASIRVAEKCGYMAAGSVSYGNRLKLLFARTGIRGP
ncbi:MAG: GNAT family N-acetyltransferase [Azospirillaceae bacterium]|nr:GNAT family N-acetyltransferase [Azospirillaceae bacterium]